MDFIDFGAPEGPLSELRGLKDVHFFGPVNQHNFGPDFEPQNGSFLTTPGSLLSVHRLSRRGPVTLYAH